MTKQRAVILEVLRETLGTHPSAEQLLDLCKKKMPGISRATVYNNLTDLEREHHIYRLSGLGGAERFDLDAHPHGHFYCINCHTVHDLHLPELQTMVERELGISPDFYDVALRGVCKECKLTQEN
jgi:Fe2+ or Zn2+ uptake regulation protein